ncbi:hypothetical protein TrVE_jg10883 [Triparma verrucosa]|uniref:Uncharacterized protein n=1 Tax=Triparma verrucosa TaxID=1606542 RepID=A0A9W7BTW9_9STRA|nr:hypothetical protein TrVE_jg10883 [Triparma verrucosa]
MPSSSSPSNQAAAEMQSLEMRPRYPIKSYTPPPSLSAASSTLQVCTLITTTSFLPGLTALLYTLTLHLPPNSPPPIIFHTLSPTNEGLPPSLRTNPFLLNNFTLKPLPKIPSTTNPQNWCYTKLSLFSPNLYPPSTSSVLYLDADCILLSSPFPYLLSLVVSSSFSGFAASPDVFPPDRFNAGVMFFVPREDVGGGLVRFKDVLGSYDGGDTGYFNRYFDDWYEGLGRLPFRFNCQRVLKWLGGRGGEKYWEEVEGEGIVVLHMSSGPKPWEEGKGRGECEVLWWGVYAEAIDVVGRLEEEGGGEAKKKKKRFKELRKTMGAKEAMEQLKIEFP